MDLEWQVRDEYYIQTKFDPDEPLKRYAVSLSISDGVGKYSAWSKHKRKPTKETHDQIRVQIGSDYYDNGLIGIFNTQEEGKKACKKYDEHQAHTQARKGLVIPAC